MRFRSAEIWKIEFVYARRIDKRLRWRCKGLQGSRNQRRIGVADMAKFVVGSSQKFVAHAQVQGQALGHAVVVLRKPGVSGDAVIVIARPAACFAEERRPLQETLEVRRSLWTGEENKAVVRDWKISAQRNPVGLSAKSELMLAVGPADRVEPDKIVGQRILQLRRIRSKRPAPELQSVHVGIAFGSGRCGQIDAQLRARNRCLIVQLVADDVDAEAEFVDQVGAEDVSFGQAAEAAVQRDLDREIQIVRCGRESDLDLK